MCAKLSETVSLCAVSTHVPVSIGRGGVIAACPAVLFRIQSNRFRVRRENGPVEPGPRPGASLKPNALLSRGAGLR